MTRYEEFSFISPGDSFLITGATGFVGQAVIGLLCGIDEVCGKGLQVTIAARDIEKAKRQFDGLSPGLGWIKHDNLMPLDIDEPIDYIICLGSETRKASFREQPADVFWQNLSGIRNCLQFAETHRGIKGVLFVSSVSAVQPGLIDQMERPDACYGVGKRMGETLCQWYAVQSGVPAKIARLFHVYGEHERYDNGTFFSDFVNNICRGEDICLKSDGRAIRNLCHVRDAARALLYICCKGENGKIYDIGSPMNHFTILEIAQLLCTVANRNGVSVKVSAQPKSVGGAVVWDQVPDTAPLQGLGWREWHDGLEEELDAIIRGILRNYPKM